MQQMRAIERRMYGYRNYGGWHVCGMSVMYRGIHGHTKQKAAGGVACNCRSFGCAHLSGGTPDWVCQPVWGSGNRCCHTCL